ncbi:MAG: ABC transporter ATP-binding protein/permease [Pseudolabrys sp.]
MTAVAAALQTFFRLALPYFRSEDRFVALALLGGMVAAELGLVAVLVAINDWNKRFFNALEAKAWYAAQAELLIFALIAVAAIVAGMAQFFLGQRLLIRWRHWLTERYVGRWMAEGRHYRIRYVAPEVDNIHLRIANDILIFLTRTHELFTGLIGSLVTILSFTVILWILSSQIAMPLFGADLSFPGYLIWSAIAMAAFGTLITHLIGRPLIPLNFRQQRFESDFRFAIARVTDQSEPVALMRGEAVERHDLGQRFRRLVRNWIALVRLESYLVGFIAGYSRLAIIVPTLMAAPAYMSGLITLGTLIQAGLAFQQMEGAFAYCIGAYSKIAEWKAVMDRIAQVDDAVVLADRARLPREDISFVDSEPGSGRLILQGLLLRSPSGDPITRIPDVSLAPGERLLVAGPSGSGKSAIIRALAGRWRLGEGMVARPARATVLAMPQRPYFPLGTLRNAICYPIAAQTVRDGDIAAALGDAGRGDLAARLDEENEWANALSGGEQQRIVFVRALLAHPDILLLDDPVSALEDADTAALFALLRERLPSTIVVSTGRPAELARFHDRIVELHGADGAVTAARMSEHAMPSLKSA